MGIIADNPFRILGAFGNSPERELEKNKSLLRAYQEIGKPMSFDIDLPFLGEVKRDSETLQIAASSIEHPKHRIRYALFWFFNSQNVDEIAFNHIKAGNFDKALEIWKTALAGKKLGPKNISIAINLSTLGLARVLSTSVIEVADFALWLRTKATILISEEFNYLVELTNADPSLMDREEVLRQFVDDAFSLVSGTSVIEPGINEYQFIEIFSDFSEEIKGIVAQKFASRPVREVEAEVTKCRRSREGEPFEADEFGRVLFDQTRVPLQYLARVLSPDSLKYQMLCDKVANEIIQCAVDVFNEFHDSEEWDPGEASLGLLKDASRLNPSGPVSKRLAENEEIIGRWVDEAGERQKFKAVETHIEAVSYALNEFDSKKTSGAIMDAGRLYNELGPNILEIRKIYGADHPFCLGITSRFVFEIMQACVSELNYVMDLPRYLMPIEKILPLIEIASTLMRRLSAYEMEPSLQAIFDKNFEGIGALYRQTTGIALTKASKSSRPEEPSKPWAFAEKVNSIFGLDLKSPIGQKLMISGIVVFVLIGVVTISLVGNKNRAVSGNNSNSIASEQPTPIVFSTIGVAKSNSVSDAASSNTPYSTTTPEPSVTITRPSTGSNISPRLKGGGRGSLSVENGPDYDLIAKLVNVSNGKTFRHVFLRRGDTYKITGISPGTYELKFAQGSSYSPELKRFTVDETYQKFDSLLDFQVTRTSDGIRWNSYRLTIMKVPYGTASTSSISAEDFKDK